MNTKILTPEEVGEILAEGWVSVELLHKHPELRRELFERAAKECEEVKKLPTKRFYRPRKK